MKKYLVLLAFWLALPLAAFSQCSAASGGGTQCVAPLSLTVQSGKSPTSTYQITPATSAFPCPPGLAVSTGRYIVCGQNKSVTVDFGDGNGYVSMQGKQGAQGPAGLSGPAGAAGSPGATGKQGVQGSQGPQGTPGVDGKDGAQGIPGPAGVTGPQGVAGATGPIGPQGIPGLTGPIGPAGPQGPAGSSGSSTGCTQGPAGPQGLPGNPGLPGAPGAPGTIAWPLTNVTITCSQGGTGVPHFNVSGCTLTVKQ